MRQLRILAGAAASLILVLPASFAFTQRPAEPSAPNFSKPGASAPAATTRVPRPVRAQAVVLTNPAPTLTYSGTVQARRLATLAFRVGGKVIERPVDVGERARAGQVLARIDPADLSLSLQAAESAVVAAEAEDLNARSYLARYQDLGRASPAFVASEYDKRLADARTAAA